MATSEEWEYELHSNFGGALFCNEKDAIKALWLLGHYHGIKIIPTAVEEALKEENYFEESPLLIKKVVATKR